MVDVQFEGESSERKILYSRIEPSAKAPRMVQWLIKAKLAKTNSQANIILIGLAMVMIVTTFFVGFGGEDPASSKPQQISDPGLPVL